MSSFDQNSDNIDSLPIDQNPPGNDEIHIIETLFKENGTKVNIILEKCKDILLIGLLFILFSIPEINLLIQKYFPATATSEYILIFVKSILFMFVYFIIKNMYLVRNR